MRGPDARLRRERADERVLVVGYLDVDVGVAAVVARADRAVELARDQLHPQADPEDWEVAVEVVGRVTDAVHVRAAREDDAVRVDLVGRRLRRDYLGVDAEVAERPPFEVGELAVEVDDDDPSHSTD